jgi:hypothetical protein
MTSTLHLGDCLELTEQRDWVRVAADRPVAKVTTTCRNIIRNFIEATT